MDQFIYIGSNIACKIGEGVGLYRLVHNICLGGDGYWVVGIFFWLGALALIANGLLWLKSLNADGSTTTLSTLQETKMDDTATSPPTDISEQMIRLSKLHADGMLTDEEFKALKAKLISGLHAPTTQ